MAYILKFIPQHRRHLSTRLLQRTFLESVDLGSVTGNHGLVERRSSFVSVRYQLWAGHVSLWPRLPLS
jgi:hypothetical protein